MKVRVNQLYRYSPNGLDRFDARADPQPGAVALVVNLPSAPPANTMGHCYVAEPTTGKFIGMVCRNSLVPVISRLHRFTRSTSPRVSLIPSTQEQSASWPREMPWIASSFAPRCSCHGDRITDPEPTKKPNHSEPSIPSTPAKPEPQPTHWWDKAKPYVECAGIFLLAIYTAYTIKMYHANQQAANAAETAVKAAKEISNDAAYRPQSILEIL
jgi:hypothetical protein